MIKVWQRKRCVNLYDELCFHLFGQVFQVILLNKWHLYMTLEGWSFNYNNRTRTLLQIIQIHRHVCWGWSFNIYIVCFSFGNLWSGFSLLSTVLKPKMVALSNCQKVGYIYIYVPDHTRIWTVRLRSGPVRPYAYGPTVRVWSDRTRTVRPYEYTHTV